MTLTIHSAQNFPLLVSGAWHLPSAKLELGTIALGFAERRTISLLSSHMQEQCVRGHTQYAFPLPSGAVIVIHAI